jgi:hypothetical protein
MHGRGKKLNQVKNYVAAEDFAKGKRIGRPKQRWIPSTFDGEPIPASSTMDDINRMITEETIASGKYVAAHWEKVNVLK